MKVSTPLTRGLAVACILAALVACSPAKIAKGPAPAGERLYVSNERGDSISVIDAVTGAAVRTLAVGKRPRGLAISPDGMTLYVALSGSAIAGPGVDESQAPAPDRSQDGIGVINLADLSIGKTIRAGNDPEAFAISPDGRTLFISNEDTSETAILDLQSGQVRARVRVGGEPEGAAVSPDGKTLLVACEAVNAVYVIDVPSAKVVGVIQVGGRPRGLVFTADGKTAYASNENSGQVSLLDIAGRKVRTVIDIPDTAGPGPSAGSPTEPKPMGLAFNADRSKLYVTTGRGRSVAEIDTASNKVARMFSEVGDRPWGVAISRDGRSLYTANGPSNDVSQVDLATGTVLRHIAAGASPWGLAYQARP